VAQALSVGTGTTSRGRRSFVKPMPSSSSSIPASVVTTSAKLVLTKPPRTRHALAKNSGSNWSCTMPLYRTRVWFLS
jgi:hypothetical protein